MPSIQQAQAKALKEGALDTFGVERAGIPTLNTLEAMLALYSEEFINRAKANLNQSDSNTTGKLSDSISSQVKILGRVYTVEFPVLDYYAFVDQGVRGIGPGNRNNTSPFKFKGAWVSKSHREAIEKWITLNNMTATASDVGRYGAQGMERKALTADQGKKRLAYLIARKHKKKGLLPTNFWSKAWDETFKDFSQQMSKALGEDVRIDLRNMNKRINGNNN